MSDVGVSPMGTVPPLAASFVAELFASGTSCSAAPADGAAGFDRRWAVTGFRVGAVPATQLVTSEGSPCNHLVPLRVKNLAWYMVRAAVSAYAGPKMRCMCTEVLVAVFFPQNDSKFLGADVLSAMSQGDLRVADTTEADDTVQVRGRIGFNHPQCLNTEGPKYSTPTTPSKTNSGPI